MQRKDIKLALVGMVWVVDGCVTSCKKLQADSRDYPCVCVPHQWSRQPRSLHLRGLQSVQRGPSPAPLARHARLRSAHRTARRSVRRDRALRSAMQIAGHQPQWYMRRIYRPFFIAFYVRTKLIYGLIEKVQLLFENFEIYFDQIEVQCPQSLIISST